MSDDLVSRLRKAREDLAVLLGPGSVPRSSGLWLEAADEIERLRTIADGLLNHCDKDGGECHVCSVICCPLKDPLHFHHDGCPSCSQEQPNG